MNSMVPEVVFKTRVRDDSLGGDNPFAWKDVSSQDIFAGRRVIVLPCPVPLLQLVAVPTCRDLNPAMRNSDNWASTKFIASVLTMPSPCFSGASNYKWQR